jgi:hypothetical protein
MPYQSHFRVTLICGNSFELQSDSTTDKTKNCSTALNHRLKPNHRSIRKPNNPNAPEAFHIGDKSFHTGYRPINSGCLSSSSNCCPGVQRCRALQNQFAVVVAYPLWFPWGGDKEVYEIDCIRVAARIPC